jgi:hypothetical protein
MLLQSAKLDRVVLASGDGDFVQVVRALQNNGCRVEVLAFQNVSYNLRCEADVFWSGYLMPGMLPPPPDEPLWGELASHVRGTCHHFNHERGFGFLRYLANVENLDVTDPREPGSPYRTAFFHRTAVMLPNSDVETLPNHDMVFEFKLAPGKQEGMMTAQDVVLATRYPGL